MESDRYFNNDVEFAYGVEEFARRLRLSPSTLYRQRAAGNLIMTKIGGRTLILKKDAEEFLRRFRR